MLKSADTSCIFPQKIINIFIETLSDISKDIVMVIPYYFLYFTNP